MCRIEHANRTLQDRPVNDPASRLKDILCWRNERLVSKNLAVHYDRKRLILDDSETVREAMGRDTRFKARFPGRGLHRTSRSDGLRLRAGCLIGPVMSPFWWLAPSILGGAATWATVITAML